MQHPLKLIDVLVVWSRGSFHDLTIRSGAFIIRIGHRLKS
jgi:hypothetical protein